MASRTYRAFSDGHGNDELQHTAVHPDRDAGRGGTGWNPLLAGDDDSIVSVEETRLDGAAAWMWVDGIHTFVMNYPDSIAAIIDFIEHGRFGGPDPGHSR